MAVLVTGGLIVAACSGAQADPTTTAAVSSSSTTVPTTSTSTVDTEPRPYGGVARIDVTIPETLNPLDPSYYTAGGGPFGFYAAAMWSVDEHTREITPHLVTEFPSLANGGMTEHADGTVTVRLSIVPDAVWEDGTPVSGEDFAFTYGLRADPRVQYHRLYERVDPASLVAGPRSLEFTLIEPGPGWEYLFFPIVPKHDVEGTDIIDDWTDRMWASAGPFRVTAVQDGRWVMTRNPNYWRTDPVTGQRLPYLDGVEVGRFEGDLRDAVMAAAPERLADAASRYFAGEDLTDDETGEIRRLLQQGFIDAVVDGRIDVLNEPLLPLSEVAAMVAASDGPVASEVREYIEWEHLLLNMGPGRFEANPGSLMEHLDFRRALAHALDRDRVAGAALGISWQRLDSYLTAYSTSLSEGGWSRYPYDPDAARALLADLCDGLGRDCDTDPPTLTISPYSAGSDRDRAIAEMTTQLAAVGIEVEAGAPTGWPGVACGTFEVLEVGMGFGWEPWTLPQGHGLWDPASPLTPTSGDNLGRWGTGEVGGIEDDPDTTWLDESCMNTGASSIIDEHTERMAEVVDEMRRTVDDDRLRLLLREAEEILADQVVFIPLFNRPQWTAWNTDLVGAGGYLYTWTAENWYRVER
jgi:ABC-type transport system substrate-binding protein